MITLQHAFAFSILLVMTASVSAQNFSDPKTREKRERAKECQAALSEGSRPDLVCDPDDTNLAKTAGNEGTEGKALDCADCEFKNSHPGRMSDKTAYKLPHSPPEKENPKSPNGLDGARANPKSMGGPGSRRSK